ncbi:flagellar basal body protein FliL [Micromonospora sp. WMMD964]|nr:flagellar basal body protein FliL [Micromonospora sp. WMMD964]WFF02105.1 flagellar basal body protein FliL [Micromonospora sp. WMMD964]
MTNYGPPGGGDPGPWRGQRPDETPGRPVQQPYPPAVPSYPRAPQGRPGPYDDPGAAPYGGQGPAPYGGGSEGPYGREQSPYGTYGADPAYGGQQYRPDEHPYGGDPAPAPSRRGRGPLIAVLAVVLLVVAAGGAFWLLRGQDDPAPSAAPSDSPVAGEPSADADVDGAEPTPSGAAPESSADPRFAKVGQCVRNDGAAGGKPKLLISGCAAKTYEVLSRIDGATSGERDAEAKCSKVEGYTNWYFFDSELDTLDFVLCLKQR